jgi:hypothetical protein
VIEDESGTILVRADEDQGLTLKTTGTGSTTIQSATTVNIAGTLQLASGNRITDSAGTKVEFGDVIDMNSNRIIELGAPVDNSDAANKSYVDTQISNLVNGAPGALDTLNELANALGDDANYASTTATALSNRLSSTATVTLVGDVTGTASFSSNTASITTTIAANSVALGTDTTGNYVGAGATSGNGISGSVSSEGGTFTVTSNATSSNTGNTIVYRDGSGNFSAGVITATATSARYADLAEKYASDADYEPGTVVHFGGEAEVTECDMDHCQKVAGVVSANPAYLMNSEADGVAVALQGRVPCKVTGPVSKGDMMVSAGNGMARAEADPKMGAVIGKALADHEGGEGVIEVVVGRM